MRFKSLLPPAIAEPELFQAVVYDLPHNILYMKDWRTSGHDLVTPYKVLYGAKPRECVAWRRVFRSTYSDTVWFWYKGQKVVMLTTTVQSIVEGFNFL